MNVPFQLFWSGHNIRMVCVDGDVKVQLYFILLEIMLWTKHSQEFPLV
jgi:hypothetical protein